jgi:short-subunit dehydrogenase
MWLIARRTERLEELAIQLNSISKDTSIRCIQGDLAGNFGVEFVKNLFQEEQSQQDFIIDTLVNNAGYGTYGTFEDTSLERQLGMIDLNVYSLTGICYAALPYLQKGSLVINVASLASFAPLGNFAVYGATKAFVLSFTRAINAELRHTGIKMMAVCPGWVKTEFFDTAVVDKSVIVYYNKFFTSEQVVTRALRDMKKGKDVSVCGFSIRAQVLLTKLLPHRLVMKIWLKQQKKK